MYTIEPDESVEVSNVNGEQQRHLTTYMSPSEPSGGWVNKERVEEAVKKMLSPSDSTSKEGEKREGSTSDIALNISTNTMVDEWKTLVVRVLSARSHDFGNSVANNFYSQELRNLSSAEHNQHVLLSRDGKRTMYPKITHGTIPSLTMELSIKMREIGDLLHEV